MRIRGGRVLDVLVIGAGMAGVTAARDARCAGLDVLVVEAQDRVGGRVHTDRKFCDLPVERGAEFIHTAEAGTLPEAREAGFDLLPCNPVEGFLLSIDGVKSPEIYNDPTFHAMGNMLGDMQRFDGPDMSAAEFVAERDVQGAARVMADLMLTIHPLGDQPELSMRGLRDDRVVELELGIDHRVAQGYDALPQWIARDLDVRFGVRIAEIHWTADSVSAVSIDGETITARTAVCTLPVGVLKSAAVRFEPDLPARKWHALNGLEMGSVMKILYRFSERFWPEDLTMLSCDGPVRHYWTPLYGRDDAPPVLTAYIGGYRARALSVLTETDAAAVGLADLDRLFPDAKPSRLVEDSRRIDWCTDPNTRGGYSFVRLGGAGSRAALAAPDTGALFWAGDGTATTTIAAVVHAAYATGRRAAGEVQAHLS